MVLFREVCAWMRHLIKTDPDAVACDLMVEEIPSASVTEIDTNDGVRTLAIHKRECGLTPRIEVRFTQHPTVYWYGPDQTDGVLLQNLVQFGFPGDCHAFDVSDTCCYLLQLAKEKFCDIKADVVLVIEGGKVQGEATNFKLMNPDLVVRVLDSLRVNTSKKITRDSLNKWLAKQDHGLTKNGNAFDFAHSVIHYYASETTGRGKTGSRKVEWEDIDALEDTFDPGHPIVEWSALKRWLDAPKVRAKLPPMMLERISADTGSLSQKHARKRIDGWLSDYVHGKELVASSAEYGVVGLGQGVIAALKSGEIPLNYLTQAEIADPFEKLMPWSYLKRSVLSYKIGSSAELCLEDTIISWLELSDLLLPLYQQDATQEDALKKALKTQLAHHVDMTLKNPAWLRKVLCDLAGIGPQSDMVRAIQTEFDFWLFDALTPAVEQQQLPMSPFAFSAERRDQVAYEDMIGCWLKFFKDHLLKSQDSFIENLTAQLGSFYKQVKDVWSKPSLDGYSPRTPSVARILEAVKTGDKAELLSLLAEDMEAESGASLPFETKEKLLLNPVLNSIYNAVRLQSVQLP